MILLQLFFSFLQVGMFSIGGGYAAMPLIQNQVVELHRWLTMAEFTDLVTIAEMTPGPIAINAATFVGTRVAGPLGAVVATFGSIFPACIIVSLLAYVYRCYQKLPALQSVLGCLRPAVVSLIAAAGLSILQTVIFAGSAIQLSAVDWIGAVLFLAAFVILRIKKWNPILVMSLCGAARLAIGLVMKLPAA
ncbi:MAG: chromate transporter [Pygmaiobacter massiliensis]